MTTYCKIRGIAEYEGWVGIVNGLVSSTSAQGDVLSVSITKPPETRLQEVYLPKSVVKVVRL